MHHRTTPDLPRRRTVLHLASSAMLAASAPLTLAQTAAPASDTTTAAPTALTTATAQDFPARPITFLVPFGAGSATDQLARAVGQAVSQKTGIPVIVENKAGASGMIATQQAAKAAPDGYTILIATNTTHAANPFLFKKLAYDPVKDFAPLTGLGKGGQILVVQANAPWHSVADLLADARRQPGHLTFGSGSASSRLAGEMLKQLAAVDILHVPYKSNPTAITDLLGGQISMMITDTATGLPHVKAGKLRALGYSTTPRNPLLPDVPTLAEAGVPGYDMSYWFAAYAPAGTPQSIIARLNQLLAEATRSEGALAFFQSSGAQAWTSTPQELAHFQASETKKWGQAIQAAGIQPE